MKTHRLFMIFLVFLSSFSPLLLFSKASGQGRVWYDGTKDGENAPPGKLLSDNAGWWGESIMTGVDYTYEQPLNNLADRQQDKPNTFGRRLLDGQISGNFWVPVAMQDRPLVAVFDFKRQCAFTEMDVISQSGKVALKVEARAAPTEAWQTVFEQSMNDSANANLHRCVLKAGTQGRYLRLSASHNNLVYLNEVYVWGDQAKGDTTPEVITPTARPVAPQGDKTLYSLPGIAVSAFSPARFDKWHKSLGASADSAAVWSLVPTWEPITGAPILPAANQISRPVSLTMARTEAGWAALALTNTSGEKPYRGIVTLSAFRRVADGSRNQRGNRASRARAAQTDDAGSPAPEVTGTIRVAGTIDSRGWGVQVGPLFEAGNKLGSGLMRKYLTNGADIADFPDLQIAPAGSAVCWLTVEAKNAPPGNYEAELTCANGGRVTVAVEVVNVTLPAPFHWLETWSGGTGMLPFVYADRQQKEVDYKQALGVTNWMGFPTPGSDAAYARQHGQALFHVGALPAGISKGKTEDETETDIIRGLVKQAQDLNLGYDDWFVELWDEPLLGNITRFAHLSQVIRKADPKVRIYCNPGFWEQSGLAQDAAVYPALKDWYNTDVDISVPVVELMDRPQARSQLFDAPRWIKAYYAVRTQQAKSEQKDQVQQYRRMAWDTVAQNYNGWAFYSYYAPRGDPWNDFDGSAFESVADYEMVYPGPRGPIPTRESESARAGWQDYCLLALLKQRGKNDGVADLLRDRASGDSMESLHTRALRLAAR